MASWADISLVNCKFLISNLCTNCYFMCLTLFVSRKKQFDNRWKHDFSGRRKPATSSTEIEMHTSTSCFFLIIWCFLISHCQELNVNVSDLRFKLENDKLRKRNHNGLRTSGVTDLRQQLSGLMHSQSTNKIEPKAMKTKAKENAKTIVKKNVQAKEAPSSETKMVTNTSSKKNILKKVLYLLQKKKRYYIILC